MPSVADSLRHVNSQPCVPVEITTGNAYVILSLRMWRSYAHTAFSLFREQKKAEEAELYDTVIFEGPPVNEQKLWPKHCVQNSWGAELHPSVKVIYGWQYLSLSSVFIISSLGQRCWTTGFSCIKESIRTLIPIPLSGTIIRCRRRRLPLKCARGRSPTSTSAESLMTCV